MERDRTQPAERVGFIGRLSIGPLATRQRLVGGILFGLAIALALVLTPNGLSASTRTVLSWDGGCLWFIVGSVVMMRGATGKAIREHAASQDEGQHLILGLVLIAAAVSLGVIASELSLAKGAHGLEKTARVAAAFGTVALSWFVVQLVFALHYAHEYYSPDENAADGIAGGLAFPNDDCPDYWDFVYFALIIGVAAQTADVSFTEKTTRRVGSVHGVVAFTFNTVVLALTINLLAGLF